MENEENLLPITPEDISGVSGAVAREAMEFMTGSADYLTENKQEKEEKKEEEKEEEDPTFLSETGAAIAGGAAQAVESVGNFAELTGDTLKTGLNKLVGNPVDETQNPFSNQYIEGDAGWFDIPDEWVPENKTGLGRFSRNVIEFGILTAATGGATGLIGGSLRLGARGIAAAQRMGATQQTINRMKFFGKGAKILGDGAGAELISDGAQEANLMNAVNEHIPWASSILSNAFAVNEEDNPWAARFKTMAVGAGMNGVGNRVYAFIKGRFAGFKAIKEGKTIDEAEDIANDTAVKTYQQLELFDEDAAKGMAEDRYSQGLGISTKDPRQEYMKKYLSKEEYAKYTKQLEDDPEKLLAEVDEQIKAAKESGDKTLVRRLNRTRKGIVKDVENKVDYDALADQRGKGVGDEFDYGTNQSTTQAAEAAGRQPDPFVNGEKFDATDKATIPATPDGIQRNLAESLADLRQGGNGKSSTLDIAESALIQMSRGDKSLYEYIKDVADDLAASMVESTKFFKGIMQRPSKAEIKALVLRQANELTSMIEGGQNTAEAFAEYFEKNTKDYRVYMDNGKKIVTASPAQKAAMQLTIHTLAKRAQDIATGALNQADGVNINRQAEMVFDSMKVLLVEHKKMGYMWGLDGQYQQLGMIPKQIKINTEAKVKMVTDEVTEYIEELKKLTRQGKMEDVKLLLEVQSMTNNVRTLEQLHDFIRAKVFGGVVNGVKIRGEFRKQIQSTFYNSILGAPITPIKAVFGTNFIAALRPLQSYLGATLKGDAKTAAIAAAEWDAFGKSLSESFRMFKHNMDQGYHRKAQSYDMKYDVGADIQEWRKLKKYIERYGTDKEKFAYNALNYSVDFNTSPAIKYSQNIMGAGDAMARTIIGRMQMRSMAAQKVIAEGADLKDVTKLSAKIEEEFRNQVFAKNSEGRYVVTDAAARMAGDEAAMTRKLEGTLGHLESFSDNPFLRAFFPFVRTGFNALDIAFQHTPLQRLMQKHKDIFKKDVSIEELAKYGIRNKAEHEAAKALLEGRMVMGNTVMAMAAFAAVSGHMTGNLPLDKATRDNWKANSIQPLSFRVPGTKTYISYANIEPFNTLLAFVADVVENHQVLGEDLTERWMQKLSFMFSSVIVDKSMLSGVEDLARLIDPETSGDLLARSGSRYLRSHIPFAGLSGAIGDIMDANMKEAQDFREMLIRRDVGAKSVLNERYDILNKDRSGKKLIYGPDNVMFRVLNAFNPFTIHYTEPDSVKETLLETRFNLPQTLSTYKEEPLNSFYMSKMQEYMSKGDLRRSLEELFDSPVWQKQFKAFKDGQNLTSANNVKLSKQSWYRAIKKRFEAAKESAINQFLEDYPDFRDKFENREIIGVLSKSGSYDELQQYLEETKHLR